MGEEYNFKKYFFWTILLVMAIVSYYLISGFIVAILSAFILSYLLLPLQKSLERKINKKASALIVILLIALLFVSFFSIIATSIISQSTEYLSKNSLQNLLSSATERIESIPFIAQFSSFFPEINVALSSAVSAATARIFGTLPGMGLTIFLSFFISFFLLSDWNRIMNKLKGILPFRDKNKMVAKISKTSNKIVYGIFLVAIIEFIIASIGFGIAGAPLFILFAFFVAIAAFIPFIGPAAVWIPLFIFQLLSNNIFSAIIILITGLILTILIDNILFHIIVGKESKIHPVILLLGVFGGVSIFGFFGFIIGPLILSLAIDFIMESTKN